MVSQPASVKSRLVEAICPVYRIAVMVAMVGISLPDISSAAAPALIQTVPGASARPNVATPQHGPLMAAPKPAAPIHPAELAEIDAEVPALVPLAPPVWAGLALLTAMACVRTRQRRRYRRIRAGQLL